MNEKYTKGDDILMDNNFDKTTNYIVKEITYNGLLTSPTTTTMLSSHSPSSTSTISSTSYNNNIMLNAQFTTIDYVFFILLLLVSALIGIYYGFISKKKQDNTKEYLLGGKTMSILPVAVSLIASHTSGSTIIGIPTEIYANGTQYFLSIIPCFLVVLALIYIYLPVFFDLQLTSSFLYLEKRFDRKVRLAASTMYTISCLLFIPIVIYVPALAFSQVTNINIHLITPIICLICVFYTTIGGLRAVVWTDTLQFVLMVMSMITIIYLGMLPISDVWQAAERGKRLIFFNMDPNPLVRASFWTVSIGFTIMWMSQLGVNQGCLQRFLSVPSFQKAKQAVWLFMGGFILVKIISWSTGLLMYAKYETCDPASIGLVNKIDQIVPFYVMDVGGKINGLPGLFIAGIFAAALSTMSSSMNTLAGSFYEDFLRNRFPDASEKKASNIMKIIVVIVGIVQLLLVFIVEKLGPIFQMTVSMNGLTSGVLLGMFTMGMVCRKANTKGVISGVCCSFIFVSIIVIGAQLNTKHKHSTLEMRTDGCNETFPNLFNSTISNFSFNNYTNNNNNNGIENSETNVDDVFWLFRISFMYYGLIGIVIIFAVGYPVSLLTGGTENLDEILLTPLLRSKEYKLKQRHENGLYSEESSELVKISKHKTIKHMEIEAAVKLLFTGQLREFATREGNNAVISFDML